MAIRTKYTSLDMIRIVKFANEHPEFNNSVTLIREYNEAYPELTKEQIRENVRKFIEECEHSISTGKVCVTCKYDGDCSDEACMVCATCDEKYSNWAKAE